MIKFSRLYLSISKHASLCSPSLAFINLLTLSSKIIHFGSVKMDPSPLIFFFFFLTSWHYGKLCRGLWIDTVGRKSLLSIFSCLLDLSSQSHLWPLRCGMKKKQLLGIILFDFLAAFGIADHSLFCDDLFPEIPEHQASSLSVLHSLSSFSILATRIFYLWNVSMTQNIILSFFPLTYLYSFLWGYHLISCL